MKGGKRSINLGQSGETPKKQVTYSIHEAPNAVQQATPLRGTYNGGAIPKGVLAAKSKIPSMSPGGDPDPYSSPSGTSKDVGRVYERPKTSRGKSCPSPDEFYDYVVPSPGKSGGSSSINHRPPYPESESVVRLPFNDEDSNTDDVPVMPPAPPVRTDSSKRAPAFKYQSSGGAHRPTTNIETIREASAENTSASEAEDYEDDDVDSSSGAGDEGEGESESSDDNAAAWSGVPDSNYHGSWEGVGGGAWHGGSSASTGSSVNAATDDDDDNAHSLSMVACWLLACALKA